MIKYNPNGSFSGGSSLFWQVQPAILSVPFAYIDMSLDDYEKHIMEKKINGGIVNYDYVEAYRFILRKDPDRFRGYFLDDPYCAYAYAIFVDCEPNDETRKASCSNSEPACAYALYVDRKPRKDTWEATKMSSASEVYQKAFPKWEVQ